MDAETAFFALVISSAFDFFFLLVDFLALFSKGSPVGWVNDVDDSAWFDDDDDDSASLGNSNPISWAKVGVSSTMVDSSSISVHKPDNRHPILNHTHTHTHITMRHNVRLIAFHFSKPYTYICIT
jgi:hypothetical protein